MSTSFTSDQTTINMATVGSNTLARTGRSRVTSIQAAGAAASVVELYDQTAAVPVGANLKAKYLFDVDGLSVYVPGSGILFKDGVTIVVVASAGATLTVSSIAATDEGFDIHIDYKSDYAVAGYQFTFLNDSA